MDFSNKQPAKQTVAPARRGFPGKLPMLGRTARHATSRQASQEFIRYFYPFNYIGIRIKYPEKIENSSPMIVVRRGGILTRRDAALHQPWDARFPQRTGVVT
ncbi:hypothetical protein [Pandoraea anapnoica]|uniref:hypothetical protein n=1 Tax=Pandoraea anapnoica TaxID=2508301 RepID=UPI0012419C46|nr:hypothetical protein [Pandoraea anapnoica]